MAEEFSPNETVAFILAAPVLPSVDSLFARRRVKRHKTTKPIMGRYDQTAGGVGLTNDDQHKPVQAMGRLPD